MADTNYAPTSAPNKPVVNDPITAADRDDMSAPRRVGPYVVQRHLSRGGMGDVFAGHDPRLDRPVAIKRVRADKDVDELMRERLRNEARLNARLNHPGIVRVYDVISDGETDYIVQEFIDGQPLDQLFSRRQPARPLPLAEGLRIATDVLEALAFAHANDVLHRDIKAENILLTSDGHVKLADFGISRPFRGTRGAGPRSGLADAASGTGSMNSGGSSSGGVSGTLRCMAPEQTRGEDVDERSDLFSFGVLLYEMFGGRSPFVRATKGATLQALVDETQPSLVQTNPRVPETLSRLVDRLLEKTPAERPSAADALRILERLQPEAAAAARSKPVGHGRVELEERQLAIGVVRAHFSLERLRAGDAVDRGTALVDLEDGLARAVEAVGGSLLSACGNVFVLSIGHPTVVDDSGAVAARVLLDVLHRFTADDETRRGDLQVSAALEVGLGTLLNRGDSASGRGGTRITGGVVDEALALSFCTQPGELLASPRSAGLLRRRFRLESNARMYMHSDGHVGPAARVIDAAPSAPHEHAPLIGRDAERDVLAEAWSSARAGEGRVVHITAPAGMGKSHLVEAWRSELVSDVPVWSLRATPQDRYVPYGALVRLMREMFGLSERDEAEQIKTLISAGVQRLGLGETRDDLTVTVLTEGLAALHQGATDADLDRTNDGPSADALDLSRSTASLVANAPVELLVGLLSARSCVLFVEDLHWIDHSTMEVIDALVGRVRKVSSMVVVTSRPGLDARWLSSPRISKIELGPLSDVSARALIEGVVPGESLADSTVVEIIRRAEGHPLLIEELTHHHAQGRGGDEGKGVPTSLRESVQRRLAGLGSARKTLESLAAVGPGAPAHLVDVVKQWSGPAFEHHVREAAQVGLLAMRGDEIAFRHALVRDAVYDGMPSGERREVHEALVALLDEQFAEVVERRPEWHAHHYEAAGRLDRALDLREAAGVLAAERRGYVEAIEHFRAALHSLAQLEENAERDRREAAIRSRLTTMEVAPEGWSSPRLKANYERTMALAQRLGQPVVLPMLWGGYIVGLTTHDRDAVEANTQAVIEAPPSPEQAFMRDNMIGVAATHSGRLEEGEVRLEAAQHLALGSLKGALPVDESLDFAKTTDWLEDVLSAPGSYLAAIYTLQGRFELAHRRQLEAELISRRSDQLVWGPAFALANRVVHGFIRSDPTYYAPILPRLRELSTGESQYLLYAGALANMGQGYYDALNGGGMRAAETWNAGFAVLEAMGLKVSVELHAARAADVWRLAGDLERAEKYCARSLELAAHEFGGIYRPQAHLAAARLDRAKGDDTAARRHVEAAREDACAISTTVPLRVTEHEITHVFEQPMPAFEPID